MTTYRIVTAPKRDSRHWTPSTITWSRIVAWCSNPGSVKEAGNYILGDLRPSTVTHPGDPNPCTNIHRRKGDVVSRGVLTLDVDHPTADFVDAAMLLLPGAALIHTTFSSSPDSPRYRVLIPLDRALLPDEYVTACRSVMRMLGEEQFDPGSSQPERYMFRPAAQHPEWFSWWEIPGDPTPAEVLLSDHEDDLSSKEAPSTRKRDPFTVEGTVGSFNRAYADDWQQLIDAYELPYEPDGVDRWHLVGARSVAGMGPIGPGLVFSHHATDPAAGVACSAFDLVRLHRFGFLDEDAKPGTPINKMPSTLAMLDLAVIDHRVMAELFTADFDEELNDIAEEHAWKTQLRLRRNGDFVDCISNWDLVKKHDPIFSLLYYNELSLSVETEGNLPWRPLGRGGPVFTSVDRAALAHHLERTYRVRPARFFVDELVNTTAQQRFVNPIREYLNSLEWDGTPRLEECLPGVKPTDYTRMVARKSMVAAVARQLDPGCKWDHSLVLFGPEGLGKSWWIDKISRGFSASLGRIGDKDTLLTMQRSWIMVSDEGHSLRKADADVQKEFLTRCEDVFRLPYERESIVHPRRCVIWGTTNDEVFLRRQEGNRRFLIVHCEERVDFTLLTDEYIDQLWAEAVHLYRGGETLFLGELESENAVRERERFTEEDALGGLLQEYLDTLVPPTWDQMSTDSRKLWLANQADGLEAPGTELQTVVCSVQLWAEALGRRPGEHRRLDLLEISNAMKRVPGWEMLPGRHRLPNYGPQQAFGRVTGDRLRRQPGTLA